MLATKKSVARIFAGLTASVLFAPACWAAATIVVNNEAPLNIQTPAGFSYLAQGDAGSLSVSTDGFLFCGNVYPDTPPDLNQVVLVPQHGDWALPTAIDVRTITYNGGSLQIDRDTSGVLDTSLVCHAVGAEGEVISALTEGVFRNSYESKAVEQYSNQINWKPSEGFDWNSPDWAEVPTDPCSPSPAQPAYAVEDVTCAAVSGARPAAAGGATRAPTMWTGTDGTNFFYVARIDARFGPQEPDASTDMQAPQAADLSGPDGSAGSVTIKVSDGYDRGAVGQGGPGYLADIGMFCVLTELPATLDGNVCADAVFSDILNGPLEYRLSLSIIPPANPRASFYFAFIRSIVGAPPSATQPAVGLSILVEPTVVAEGGDKFRGDDVIFGFLPTSPGFPWMTGSP
jgi:hypothetical protein